MTVPLKKETNYFSICRSVLRTTFYEYSSIIDVWRVLNTPLFYTEIFLDRNHSFNTYAKFPEKLSFTYFLVRIRTCSDQWVQNVIFAENFAYVINE